MATAMKCDRCNGLYEIYNNKQDPKHINGLQTMNVSADRSYYAGRYLDICPRCCKEFVEWFEEFGNGIDKEPVEKKEEETNNDN
jgi:hypothetical protein